MQKQESLFKDMGQEGQENTYEGNMVEVKPLQIPVIEGRAGYKTSQGQLTAVFALAAILLSIFGFKDWTPEKIENIYNLISQIFVILGPLVALVPVLISYINSRGKIASNSIWASASTVNGGFGKDGIPVTPIASPMQTLPAVGLNIAESMTKEGTVLDTALDITKAVVIDRDGTIKDGIGNVMGKVVGKIFK